jgi:hypothetical protein
MAKDVTFLRLGGSMFTICFDTICQGFQPVMEEVKDRRCKYGYRRQPVRYSTEAEARAELESDPAFYQDCFVCPVDQIGHKTIFTGKQHP